MQTKNDLADLISKLLSGAITPEENEVLRQFMIKDEYKDMFIDWLQVQWNNESRRMNVIPDQTLFSKIEAEIAGKVGENRGNGENRGKVLKNPKWKILLRYAAVFLLAFALSWEIQLFTSKDDTKAMVETDPLYNEIVVPYGSKTKVILPDNSTVWLNSGARLKYPTYFDNLLRKVYLQGEGFFDVVKDPQHPFVVNGSGINIKVTGTKFNLMANAEEQIIETTLVEGEIEISGLRTEIGEQGRILLKPGQKLALRKENELYEVHNIHEAGLIISGETTVPVRIKSADLYEKTNVLLATAWTENKLVFVRERFENVKTKLERWYGVTIEVKEPEIFEYRFTGTFEKQTFEQAMNVLSKAASCKFIIEKNHVIVSKY